MKTRTKIIIPVIVVFALGLFYLYIVANGYSPYIEGIGLTYYYETNQDKVLAESSLSTITEITDEDLQDVPRIKGMLKIALKQEFPLYDDGFSLFDENLNSYWLNRDGQNIDIQIGMSYDNTKRYGKWLQDNLPHSLMKYQDRYFSFSQWIA